MKIKVTEWFATIFCVLVGIGIITGGMFWVNSTAKFRENAVQTIATVTSVSERLDSDGEDYYAVYVTYNVDGKEYNGCYSTHYYVSKGSTETIYYDENDPGNMKTSISYASGVMMIVFGIIFAGVGLTLIYSKISGANKKKKLIENGDKIYADFKEVSINNSYAVNNRHPYNIICIGKDNITGEERIFKSENIWENPEYIIKQRNITRFPIYIDINNRKKYYLSLEEIENV